jgi:hypothetical protein
LEKTNITQEKMQKQTKNYLRLYRVNELRLILEKGPSMEEKTDIIEFPIFLAWPEVWS